MKFEWNEAKNKRNRAKHGIPFEDAMIIFSDPEAKTVIDNRFDYGEERKITFGRLEGRLCVVISTGNLANDTIRIISARKANQRESQQDGNS